MFRLHPRQRHLAARMYTTATAAPPAVAPFARAGPLSLEARLAAHAASTTSRGGGRMAFTSSAPTSRPASPSTKARRELLTLAEIDKLLTHIGQHSTKTQADTPMVMRAHPVPWMKPGSGCPDLPGDDKEPDVPPALSAEERDALVLPKHMSSSYTSFDLPLASNPKLYDSYVNFSGGFRMGKLLENLDSLAGAVAYRHCLVNSPPADGRATENFHHESARAGIYIATASADRLDMFGKLNSDSNVQDLKFSGFVTWTGNSSMEVFVKMEGTRPGSGKSNTLMLGRFSMVCRDSHTHKARRVPPLIVETEEEQLLWEIGEQHKEKRAEFSKRTLDKQPPSSEEAAAVHNFMLAVKGKDEYKGEKVVPMKDTKCESVQLMFPQERNLHGKVFGGFLMRQAFELCFTNAATFAHSPMRFLSLDQITFRLPVPIGAVVRFTSKVVRTTQPGDGPPSDGLQPEAKVHIVVKVEVEDVATGERKETNSFYFTMAKDDGLPIGRVVVPETYEEAMQYLEGTRRLAVGDEMRRLYLAEGFEQA